jgi:hypothetical protein
MSNEYPAIMGCEAPKHILSPSEELTTLELGYFSELLDERHKGMYSLIGTLQ